METLRMELGENSHDIYIGRDLLRKADGFLDLNRKVLIVTDDGVPEAYSRAIASQAKEPFIVTFKAGEASKNLDNWQHLLKVMLEEEFSRKDCVTAVGGGVIGDMAGFAASSYMRGVTFYNCPTTTLSQVDSSIGGKVAVDFEGIKNMVGAFYQPAAVLIDIDTLKTQNSREYANGLAEAVKTGLIGDARLFELLENGDGHGSIEEIIHRCLLVKKRVVEQDQHEAGLRKILNFGHTLGHAVEASADGRYLHGEAVGIGMVPMCHPDIRERLIRTLKKYELPVLGEFDRQQAEKILVHDKKNAGGMVDAVYVETIGTAEIRPCPVQTLMAALKEVHV